MSTTNQPADTAGGEEEPVHEDAAAVVVGIVGQQAVPLVLLLAGTVAVASVGRWQTKHIYNQLVNEK